MEKGSGFGSPEGVTSSKPDGKCQEPCAFAEQCSGGAKPLYSIASEQQREWRSYPSKGEDRTKDTPAQSRRRALLEEREAEWIQRAEAYTHEREDRDTAQ